MTSSFDIIGDIHGQADKLEALLRSLGYRYRQGAWRHPSRQALFVGDFVDRGPGQLRVLEVVREMTDAGSAQAVMGNHEFNAIAFFLEDPANPGRHLRVRSEKNRRQHQRFLDEVGEDSPTHREWVGWFLDLPLWLETPDLRAVHACWHPQHMEFLSPFMGPGNRLTVDLIERASRRDSDEYLAVEALCKGLEVDLPEPVSYTDAEGTRRTRTRTRWWDSTARDFRSAALLPRSQSHQLPQSPLPSECVLEYDELKPVFFGHYWLTGKPGIQSPKICCVDYSAARDEHPLVAYRFDGEQELDSSKLVAVGLPNDFVARRSIKP